MEGDLLLTAITNGSGVALGFAGDIVTALTTSGGELVGILSAIGLGISCSGIMFGTRLVRGMVWGW